MAVVTERPLVPTPLAAGEPEVRARPVLGFAAALPAIALAIGSLLVGSEPSSAEVVRAILVLLWAAAGMALTVRRPQTRLGPLVLVGATVGAVGAMASALETHRSPTGAAGLAVDLGIRMAAALLPAVALHFLLALPNGLLATPGRRRGVIAMYLTSAVVGVALLADRDRVITWPVILLWLIAFGCRARRRARPLRQGRRRRPPAHAVGRLGAGRGRRGRCSSSSPCALLTDWPDRPGAVALALTGLVPARRSSPARSRRWSPASTACSRTPSRSPGSPRSSSPSTSSSSSASAARRRATSARCCSLSMVRGRRSPRCSTCRPAAG